MNEAAITLDGWYCLHDFRAIDWAAWRTISTEEREQILAEFHSMINKWEQVEEKELGSHAIYSIVGQKADLMLMILRPTMKELNEIEDTFNKSRLAEFTIPTYSYVSVVELSNYMGGEGDEDPYQNPYIRSRLYPALPKAEHVCFYPMDKRRNEGANWFMLPMEERRSLMKSHGLIGRSYAGKVKQVITGSVGFDDWEWGVTLFAEDVLQFKKLIYEMRFDEVSARYAEFGSFYVGNILEPQNLSRYFHI